MKTNIQPKSKTKTKINVLFSVDEKLMNTFRPVAKKYGNKYGKRLEPKIYPDAINHKNFISPILCKNEQYSSIIIMKLRNDF